MHRSRSASFASELGRRLVAGTSLLPSGLRVRQAEFLPRAQAPTGGFRGREGGADLYYTSFAARAFELLGTTPAGLAQETLAFVERTASTAPSLSDVVSELEIRRAFSPAGNGSIVAVGLCRKERRARLLARVDAHRTPDGGYRRTPDGGASTYGTFLAILACQYLDTPVPDPERVRTFLLSRQRADGGFAESDDAQTSGTNPTAAAVIGLLSLSSLRRGMARRSTAFLAGMAAPAGGLRANCTAPVPDLLSTFTGLVALAALSGLGDVRLGQMARFAQGLEAGDGGFRGVELDRQADVEYTYYGLGTLALLAAVAHDRRSGLAAKVRRLWRLASHGLRPGRRRA